MSTTPQPPSQMDRIEALLTEIRDLLRARQPERFDGSTMGMSGPLTGALPAELEPYRNYLSPQPQTWTPAPGKAGPVWCYPNPALTPGVTNPQVTQETVATTIAVSGWTATIRPHVSVTSIIKDHIMARDGLIGPASLYELDHFISLELGGHPSDIGNLWCQPYAPSGVGAHEKDHVENWLKTQVVTGVMTLAKAQQIITTDWYDCYLHLSKMGLLPEMVSFDPDGSSDPDDEG